MKIWSVDVKFEAADLGCARGVSVDMQRLLDETDRLFVVGAVAEVMPLVELEVDEDGDDQA